MLTALISTRSSDRHATKYRISPANLTSPFQQFPAIAVPIAVTASFSPRHSSSNPSLISLTVATFD